MNVCHHSASEVVFVASTLDSGGLLPWLCFSITRVGFVCNLHLHVPHTEAKLSHNKLIRNVARLQVSNMIPKKKTKQNKTKCCRLQLFDPFVCLGMATGQNEEGNAGMG